MPRTSDANQTEVVRRYARLQVPRYTSYPTAAEFNTGVTAETHALWLQEFDTSRAVSLYIHVPYCRDICGYCGCNTKKAVRDDVVSTYREALEAEIDLVARTMSRPLRIGRIHWGGGTPTILGAAGLSSVVEKLHRHFSCEADAEHAIESLIRDMRMCRSCAPISFSRWLRMVSLP